MTPENLKEIGGIGFSILSPSEVRKYSVTEITAPETYDPKTPSLSSLELYAIEQEPFKG